MEGQPRIAVGIVDRKTRVEGHLENDFQGNGFGPVSGRFSARADAGAIVLSDRNHLEICRSPTIRLTPIGDSIFRLFHVKIGNRFHWERMEDQTFHGDLILKLRDDGTIVAINEISLEDYLASVISSEMNPSAPIEFLKTQAIVARSWLLALMEQKKGTAKRSKSVEEAGGEITRWYDREGHDLFDVCADDHCQRYQGITKISEQAEEALRRTRGMVITYQGQICDARYSKACGGLTEEFETAWDNHRLPYLTSISDSLFSHCPIKNEQEASAWILSEPEAYCHVRDQDLLEKILPDLDRHTRNFFRWRVEYSRAELEEILKEKSGLDFGKLREIVPLQRGPSGRIFRLKIIGSKRSMVVGKELEIRRWLSWSHLYSSAFVVKAEEGRFVFHGAGWGHGVGLCQIGAAAMAAHGFSAEEILRHYFQGVEVKKIY
ncbi:MAG: SpoIID/LytB domain-containing protein [Syntrophaceae bacterium]|nr:SpoIID/LytB domain-containing protein [Syntrophaceae bacterium]